MSGVDIPPPRPVCHVYVVVDKRDPNRANPTPLGVGLTRQEAKSKIDTRPDADRPHLRARRARATLYES
jgi:hypothetical protein